MSFIIGKIVVILLSVSNGAIANTIFDAGDGEFIFLFL